MTDLCLNLLKNSAVLPPSTLATAKICVEEPPNHLIVLGPNAGHVIANKIFQPPKLNLQIPLTFSDNVGFY